MNIKNRIKGFLVSSLTYLSSFIDVNEDDDTDDEDSEEEKDEKKYSLDIYDMQINSEEDRQDNRSGYRVAEEKQFDPLHMGYGAHKDIEMPNPIVEPINPKERLEDIADTHELITDPNELKYLFPPMRDEKTDYLSQGLRKKLEESAGAE
ncbi:hypothetical protein GF361_05520 [Candidatus Woesearchaeota archaeon]|nr:hypothetical protein [Candidatus Woesearchaeota archaeon]